MKADYHQLTMTLNFSVNFFLIKLLDIEKKEFRQPIKTYVFK